MYYKPLSLIVIFIVFLCFSACSGSKKNTTQKIDSSSTITHDSTKTARLKNPTLFICNDNIKFRNLPDNIKNYLTEKYPDYMIPALKKYTIYDNDSCIFIPPDVRINRDCLPYCVPVDLNRDNKIDYVVVVEYEDTVKNVSFKCVHKLNQIILLSHGISFKEYQNNNVYGCTGRLTGSEKYSFRLGYLKAGKYSRDIYGYPPIRDTIKIPFDGFITYGELQVSGHYFEKDSLVSKVLQQGD
jgi:hypothetical protein